MQLIYFRFTQMSSYGECNIHIGLSKHIGIQNKNEYLNIYTEFALKHNGPIRLQNICCVNQERYDISQIYHVARYFTITYISIK